MRNIVIYELDPKAFCDMVEELGKRVYRKYVLDSQSNLYQVTLGENVIFKTSRDGILTLDLGGKKYDVSPFDYAMVKIL